MSVTKARKPQSNVKSPQARINFRLDPEIKARLVRAAAITGQELTDFAVSTLSEKANQVIEHHNTVELNIKQYEFFLKALDGDKEPSNRSQTAAKRYMRGRRKGVGYQLAD